MGGTAACRSHSNARHPAKQRPATTPTWAVHTPAPATPASFPPPCIPTTLPTWTSDSGGSDWGSQGPTKMLLRRRRPTRSLPPPLTLPTRPLRGLPLASLWTALSSLRWSTYASSCSRRHNPALLDLPRLPVSRSQRLPVSDLSVSWYGADSSGMGTGQAFSEHLASRCHVIIAARVTLDLGSRACLG